MATQRGVLHRTITLCKRHGFLFQSPRSTNKGSVNYIYGPLGAELKRNLLNEWWYAVVTSAGNVHPIESSLLTHHPTSLNGACMNFTTDDSEGKNEEMHTKEPIKETDSEVKEREEEYLPLRSDIRPNGLLYFLDCVKTMGLKIPFGIAETGKVLNSEPSNSSFNIYEKEYDTAGVQFFCAPQQERQWYSHWQKKRLRWWKKFANHPEWVALGEGEVSTSQAQEVSTIQFHFPWGFQSVENIANRGNSDFQILSQTLQFKESSLKHVRIGNDTKFPHLISLAANIDRAVLAYLCNSYTETERSYGSHTDFKLHSVLKLHICLAPFKVAVLPMDETNDKLCKYCHRLAEELRCAGISTIYCGTGSYEHQMTQQDEIGTPYRILADKKTLETGIVTMQDRDTTATEEMNGCDVLHIIQRMLHGARLN